MRAGRPAAITPLIWLLTRYQRWISPFLGPRCRFYPSCSQYTVQALTKHGLGRGSALAVRRLLRCQPFSAGGVDPVPDVPRRRTAGPQSPSASTGAPSC